MVFDWYEWNLWNTILSILLWTMFKRNEERWNRGNWVCSWGKEWVLHPFMKWIIKMRWSNIHVKRKQKESMIHGRGVRQDINLEFIYYSRPRCSKWEPVRIYSYMHSAGAQNCSNSRKKLLKRKTIAYGYIINAILYNVITSQYYHNRYLHVYHITYIIVCERIEHNT